MKRIIALLLILTMLCVAFSVVMASPHRWGNRGYTTVPNTYDPDLIRYTLRENQGYSLCPVYGCATGSPHRYGSYSCYERQRYWQDDATPCPVEGCEIYGYHEHDGIWYHCAAFNPPDLSANGFIRGGCCRAR